MEFKFETVYNQKALTVMAKTLRKTIRKKKSQRTHIFGWIVLAFALMISLPVGKDDYTVGINTVVTWIASAVIFITLFLRITLTDILQERE